MLYVVLCVLSLSHFVNIPHTYVLKIFFEIAKMGVLEDVALASRPGDGVISLRKKFSVLVFWP